MKTCKISNYFSILILCLISVLFLITGCSNQDDPAVPLTPQALNSELNNSNPSARAISLPEVVHLEGLTLFDAYAVKEKLVVVSSDWDQLNCKATLTHVKDQDYILETKEYFGDVLAREITWNVKMTPSGVLNFAWPVPYYTYDPSGLVFDNPADVVRFHTGYKVVGEGVNKNTLAYKGNFDGEHFYAATTFMGKWIQPGALEFFIETEGPVKLVFGIDLHVVAE